jgi:hypothetical protein
MAALSASHVAAPRGFTRPRCNSQATSGNSATAGYDQHKREVAIGGSLQRENYIPCRDVVLASKREEVPYVLKGQRGFEVLHQ